MPFNMNSICSRLFLLALIGGVAMSAAHAKGVDDHAIQGSLHIWYDGEREQQVWLSDNEVIEFRGAPSAQSGKALKSLVPQARLEKVIGIANIWVIETTAELTLKALSAKSKTSDYSPVFRRSPSRSSPRMALPGNIIVTFKPEWSLEQIEAWAQQRQLQIQQPLPVGVNMFVIKTEPGIASLELANELYLSGEVLAATPNWWREVFTR